MSMWAEFAWATFFYWAQGGDRDYQDLMEEQQFLNDLRTAPSEMDPVQVQDKVIAGFLNRWRCRLPNTRESAQAILGALQDLHPYLQVLRALDIRQVNFEQNTVVNREQITIQRSVAMCYERLRKSARGLGPTAVSKLLHILQPKLFVMWDRPILDEFHRRNHRIQDSGTGYCAYLRMMQEIARQVTSSFQDAVLDPPATADQTPAAYLSTQMGYRPPKTMAKFLDEFNWVRISKQMEVPPLWHP